MKTNCVSNWPANNHSVHRDGRYLPNPAMGPVTGQRAGDGGGRHHQIGQMERMSAAALVGDQSSVTGKSLMGPIRSVVVGGDLTLSAPRERESPSVTAWLDGLSAVDNQGVASGE